jgi:hypothetical protein
MRVNRYKITVLFPAMYLSSHLDKKENAFGCGSLELAFGEIMRQGNKPQIPRPKALLHFP